MPIPKRKLLHGGGALVGASPVVATENQTTQVSIVRRRRKKTKAPRVVDDHTTLEQGGVAVATACDPAQHPVFGALLGPTGGDHPWSASPDDSMIDRLYAELHHQAPLGDQGGDLSQCPHDNHDRDGTATELFESVLHGDDPDTRQAYAALRRNHTFLFEKGTRGRLFRGVFTVLVWISTFALDLGFNFLLPFPGMVLRRRDPGRLCARAWVNGDEL